MEWSVEVREWVREWVRFSRISGMLTMNAETSFSASLDSFSTIPIYDDYSRGGEGGIGLVPGDFFQVEKESGLIHSRRAEVVGA